jgi:hypothetical protein
MKMPSEEGAGWHVYIVAAVKEYTEKWANEKNES